MSLELTDPPVLEPGDPFPEIPPMSEQPFKSEFLRTMQARGFIHQIGLRENAAADRDHRIGREDEGAAQLVVELHGFQRRIGLGAGETIGAGARQLAPLRGLIDIGRTQRVGLDAGLVEQAEPSRRTGSENDFGTAKHAGCVGDLDSREARAEPIGRHSIPQPGNK